MQIETDAKPLELLCYVFSFAFTLKLIYYRIWKYCRTVYYQMLGQMVTSDFGGVCGYGILTFTSSISLHQFYLWLCQLALFVFFHHPFPFPFIPSFPLLSFILLFLLSCVLNNVDPPRDAILTSNSPGDKRRLAPLRRVSIKAKIAINDLSTFDDSVPVFWSTICAYWNYCIRTSRETAPDILTSSLLCWRKLASKDTPPARRTASAPRSWTDKSDIRLAESVKHISVLASNSQIAFGYQYSWITCVP